MDIEDIGSHQSHRSIRQMMKQSELELLETFLRNVVATNSQSFQKALRSFLKANRLSVWPSKSDLLRAFRSLEPVYQTDTLNRLLVKKEMRSQSGVLVVAVFTAAHPSYTDAITGERKSQEFSCKHNCYYCPLEPAHEGNGHIAQPRSYLFNEPGVRRANDNDFDAARQVWARLDTYISMGHPIDKIELIVLGGTWSEYPLPYRDEFIRDLYWAVNTYKSSKRERWSLHDEQVYQDLDAPIKIIGLTLETRPDTIDLKELKHFRSLGCTRVQLGVQHTDDEVLMANGRGHGITESKAAITCLKASGFKVDIHLMPNLFCSTVEKDEQMFDTMLSDPALQADDWKIYPCSVVPWSELNRKFESGEYRPYDDDQLQELLIRVKAKIPPWIRLNRIIRDIPVAYIAAGCQTQHMRCNMKSLVVCRCIRCREVKNCQIAETKLVVRRYAASGGEELFISFESLDESTIYGFLRLRVTALSFADQPSLDAVKNCALIRELHVYGQVLVHNDKETNNNNDNNNDNNDNNDKKNTHIQHNGMGKALMAKAEDLARSEGYTKIAVISGIGVRGYYRRLGYVLDDTYMVKRL